MIAFSAFSYILLNLNLSLIFYVFFILFSSHHNALDNFYSPPPQIVPLIPNT
jgi:hypothetical protein